MAPSARTNGFLAAPTAPGRTGPPDDIAGVVAMLRIDKARWLNAQRPEAANGVLLWGRALREKQKSLPAASKEAF